MGCARFHETRSFHYRCCSLSFIKNIRVGTYLKMLPFLPLECRLAIQSHPHWNVVKQLSTKESDPHLGIRATIYIMIVSSCWWSPCRSAMFSMGRSKAIPYEYTVLIHMYKEPLCRVSTFKSGVPWWYLFCGPMTLPSYYFILNVKVMFQVLRYQLQ